MSAAQFIAGVLRTAAIIVPAVIAAHRLRIAWLRASGAIGALAEAVLALSILLVAAELLGLLSIDHPPELTAVLVLAASTSWALVRPPASGLAEAAAPRAAKAGPYALVAVIVVVAQWCVQTANALGGGMFNFDTLWYHMPFAARFAQTGGVTGIQFTQADPFVAYYPANSELLHGIGIAAMHNDFLSPLLNLMWLAIALLASWCVGRRWQVAPLTLTAGCLLLSLPVLSGTQPGEAFNDIVGLAALLAAAALLLEAADAARGAAMLVVAGLALGLAVGTKLTFIVPAFVLVAGVTLAARGRGVGHSRARVFGLVAGPLALTGGWWYVRNLIDVGNPVGLRIHLGPLTLPGPVSPLANQSQQTVFSQLRHLSLWGSRFVPGLDHAFGPLWPVALGLYFGAIIAGIRFATDPTLRTIVVAAATAGISYLLLPTGATGIEQGTTLFQVNLRYATPALGLAILALPIVAHRWGPTALARLGWALAAVVLATQLEHALWPTQTARHLAFLVGIAVVTAIAWRARAIRRRQARVIGAVAVGAVLAGAAGAYAVQRHYVDRRYLLPDKTDPALGTLYRWAQGVANARIALYGTVEQYPLYGARDTNQVDYLGAKTADGNYRPIARCRAWRAAVNRGRYRYVVLTPGPTAPIPAAWTRNDPAARLVLNPAPGTYVFAVTGRFQPALCT